VPCAPAGLVNRDVAQPILAAGFGAHRNHRPESLVGDRSTRTQWNSASCGRVAVVAESTITREAVYEQLEV
jgi:hypothetical protein